MVLIFDYLKTILSPAPRLWRLPGLMVRRYDLLVTENPRVEKEELDFDEDIRREKRMQEEVDKFLDDSDSELSMLHSKVSNLEVKGEKELKCKRCGK